MKKSLNPLTVNFVLLFCIVIWAEATAQQIQPDSPRLPNTSTITDTIPDTLQKKKFVLLDTTRYRFTGDGNFARGNVNRTVMVLRAELLFTGPVISIVTNPRFTYGKQNGILAERDSYGDLFVDVFKKRRTYLFGLGILENSNLRRIDLRKMAGAGLGFRVLNTKTNNLTLTNAIVYESTNFREKATVTTARNSFRVKGKHAFLQDKIRLNHITFMQPSLSDMCNLRWNTIVSVELPLNKYVTLRTSFENFYESVVETSRKRNDSRLTFGVAIGNKH
ncbi:DUF481 domain-containing protein [Dyadobacter sp. 32]|uniref:DUF481 domain-containing protein n=1 Tax=Dyadobacter sp. 32 TaxID=538966 RepID=UPI0011ECA9ED